MKEIIKFTIAIPAFKHEFLDEAISSVIGQTYSNWELIILDDDSPFHLKEICKKYLSDSRVRYYKNNKNVGALDVVNNWNKCLSLSSGEYIICMGDDDILCPDCLETYNIYLKKFPTVELFHASTMIIDEKSSIIRYLGTRPLQESVFSMVWYRLSRKRDQYIGDFLFNVNKLKTVGGFFYQPIAWASDDITAYLCASEKGVVNIPQYIFKYRENRHSISSTSNIEYKLQAILSEKKWIGSVLLEKEPVTKLDKRFKKLISESLTPLFSRKLISTIGVSCKDNFFKTIFFITRNKKEYKIGTRELLLGGILGILYRLIKHVPFNRTILR